MLVGGAAFLGVVGIASIGAIQGLSDFKEQKNDMSIITCCDVLEDKIKEIEIDFEKEEKDQDRLEIQQRSLCNLVRTINMLSTFLSTNMTISFL